jgi:hypothetical protein
MLVTTWGDVRPVGVSDGSVGPMVIVVDVPHLWGFAALLFGVPGADVADPLGEHQVVAFDSAVVPGLSPHGAAAWVLAGWSVLVVLVAGAELFVVSADVGGEFVEAVARVLDLAGQAGEGVDFAAALDGPAVAFGFAAPAVGLGVVGEGLGVSGSHCGMRSAWIIGWSTAGLASAVSNVCRGAWVLGQDRRPLAG